ncbi:restriction endonuclease subunit S [Parashewanella spongiae]|uniref:Restriction endonuclease subunit S n=1 Tax=Parashewanella spongiae TaxID=342950 RepID=A0A3A6U3A0_9GAMM|nr:restriction endonuclease subunit S [Parashewanella spongiae]MCL1077279.1 restriction endonuclease subunit S [Parashewanella spongiae]RJY18541.1 restriction endonuclease subunit S [Parashewanella spongiae]
MSDLVPDGWSFSYLSELCKFAGGSAFNEKYQGCNVGDYPFIKVSDMNIAGNERFITKSNNWIDEKTRLEGKTKLFPSKSVVFAKVGAALLLNRRRILIRDTAIDNNMMAATPYIDNGLFLYYLLQDIDLGDIVQSGAVPSVNQSQMDSIQVLVPPLPEQQKIAKILTSVDEVIEKTQAQINKLKDLKTGMMQELLTNGIGHTEFKDSPVGRIPVEWEVVQISKLCIHVVDCVNKTAQVVDHKTPYKMIRTTNVRHGRVDTENVRYVTKETFEAWTRRLLPEDGDLIFTREAPVGECGILNDSRGVFLGQRTMMYRADERLTSSQFLMYSIMSDYGKQQLEDFSGGSTVAHMRVPDCEKILIKLPPLGEQNQIVASLNSIDDCLIIKERKLSKSIDTKKALMQDLLTGKVRVQSS